MFLDKILVNYFDDEDFTLVIYNEDFNSELKRYEGLIDDQESTDMGMNYLSTNSTVSIYDNRFGEDENG